MEGVHFYVHLHGGSTFHVHLHGGSTFYVHLHGGSTFYVHSPFFIIACFISLQVRCLSSRIFLDCWEVWYLRYANHPFYVLVIHILIFHFHWRTPLPFLVNALVGSFTLLNRLYLYPNGYGVVVLVGLMFATIICYIHRFVTYK